MDLLVSALFGVFDVWSDDGIHVHFVVKADDFAVVICEFCGLDSVEGVVFFLA